MSKVEAGRFAPAPAQLFAALGDPTRLNLVLRLADGQVRSMAQMGQDLPISRQAVAKHLDVLLGAGLVRRTKNGREMRFALEPRAVHAARDWLDSVGAQWDHTLGRLKLLVEQDS